MSDAMKCEVTGISLRLRHKESKDLGPLIEKWGLSVGRSWRAGEPRSTAKGRMLEGKWPESYAYGGLPLVGAVPLHVELDSILRILGPPADDLAAFAADGGRAELFVHWHFFANSGDILSSTLLRRLSDLHLDLALDVYPESDWLDGADVEAARVRPRPTSH